jgi:glycerol-3-phosphate acyltransferase PlsX
MRIALDAMGGDRAPAAPVEGAVAAIRAQPDLEVLLVGEPQAVEAELARHDLSAEERRRLPLEPAPRGARMGDDPVRAVRTDPGNSARVCAERLRDGAVEGVVNMGSTGAAVAAAHLFCGRLPGVRRPAIAIPVPRGGGGATVLLDCGANPDARPEDLRQYAVMGSHYAQSALGVPEPRVGILSIGEEEHKGNRLVHETWAVFRQNPPARFVGNVEPRELFEDRADVVVTDGFTGNVVLKTAEGMAEYLVRVLEEILGPGGDGVGEAFRQLGRRVDYAEYGGAPLLGVRGAYMIGHGRSNARAVASGLAAARRFVAGRAGDRIVAELADRALAAPAEGGA